jgi:hypothetical protein
MTDLFDSIEEAKDERRAIQMADGIETTIAELHRCEVITVVRRYFPDGDPKPFFADVEKKRGKEAADKLRADCRKEWASRRECDELTRRREAVDADKVQK